MKPASSIINMCSINAFVGRPDLLDFTSTKGAIVSFTRGLSNQILSEKKIRVVSYTSSCLILLFADTGA